TSDMPVAAREASIYTGITIAEYFRDMGYSVAVMADSTSRWAEALREMGGRLEEMPGDEGYPAYLSSRLAEFYERAGSFVLLGDDTDEGGNIIERLGTITAIGAVSPPGGDMSEPVVQATLRIIKVFWGLSASLAYKRHFPAIDWNTSYSLYQDRLGVWFDKNVDSQFNNYKKQMALLLTEESRLLEIVRFIGMDALEPKDKLSLDTSKSIREDFLHQNAFDKVDSFTDLNKQFKIIKLIIDCHNLSKSALERGADISDLLSLKARERVSKAKTFEQEGLFDEVLTELKQQLAQI
ncbi:MAG: V-type ATP synthase subunit A, partial [Firmicutes bacterium]|nr:V-type ATP synthase subunit A [Bacillota bacterium]